MPADAGSLRWTDVGEPRSDRWCRLGTGSRPRLVETADTVTLGLEAVDEPIADHRPGQFTMLYAFGVGEVPISVSGCPGPGRAACGTRSAPSAPRPGRSAASRPGAMVGVRGPFGVGWPVAAAEGPTCWSSVAASASLRCAPSSTHVLAERERFGRVAVLVGARTPADVLYQEELADWRDACRAPGRR